MKTKSLAVLAVALVFVVACSGVGNIVQLAHAQLNVSLVSMFTNRRFYHFGDTIYLTIRTSHRMWGAVLYIMNPDGNNFWMRLGRIAGLYTMTFYASPPAGRTVFILYVNGNVAASTQAYVGW